MEIITNRESLKLMIVKAKEDLLIAVLLLVILLIFQIGAIVFQYYTMIMIWSGIIPIIHYIVWLYWAFKLAISFKIFKELKKQERFQNEQDQIRKQS